MLFDCFGKFSLFQNSSSIFSYITAQNYNYFFTSFHPPHLSSMICFVTKKSFENKPKINLFIEREQKGKYVCWKYFPSPYKFRSHPFHQLRFFCFFKKEKAVKQKELRPKSKSKLNFNREIVTDTINYLESFEIFLVKKCFPFDLRSQPNIIAV